MIKLKKALSFSGVASTAAAIALVATFSGCTSLAKDPKQQQEMKVDANYALTKFYGEATNARKMVQDAQGILICPNITKAGFVVGVKGGKCAMQINGTTQEYYRTTSVNVGLIAGVESHSLLLIFNDISALNNFREGNRNWKVGGNLSVTVAQKGMTGAFDSKTTSAAISAFVYSEAGLMGDLSVEGSTFKKLEK